MDCRETKCQGICQRLFDFIVKGLAVQVLKKSTLGDPTTNGKVDTKTGQIVHLTARPGLEKTNSTSLRSLLENDRAEEEGSLAQPKAPKKMVSINDRVEDMHKAVKIRRKSKSFEKSISFVNGEDEPKPLRPILKAASNLDEKANGLVKTNHC